MYGLQVSVLSIIQEYPAPVLKGRNHRRSQPNIFFLKKMHIAKNIYRTAGRSSSALPTCLWSRSIANESLPEIIFSFTHSFKIGVWCYLCGGTIFSFSPLYVNPLSDSSHTHASFRHAYTSRHKLADVWEGGRMSARVNLFYASWKKEETEKHFHRRMETKAVLGWSHLGRVLFRNWLLIEYFSGQQLKLDSGILRLYSKQKIIRIWNFNRSYFSVGV